MQQRTLVKSYSFEGKGLHTGRFVRMAVGPAPADTGIRFRRTDLGPDAFVDALAENVSSTARSTTISRGKVKVGTIEHILSALTGLGIDNALIEIDGPEVPILDGSARVYLEAIAPDGAVEQDAPRRWVELSGPVELSNPKTGSSIRIEPSDRPLYDVTIDFNSRVLGVQRVQWDDETDYCSQIGICRTFCFFHEILRMALFGLVKGGDVNNAIVIVEKPTKPRQLARMARLFNQEEGLTVTPEGYLGNIKLRFPDECGRHKLLDLIGDLRLSGGFLKARVTAYKPGHRLNTGAAKQIREIIKR